MCRAYNVGLTHNEREMQTPPSRLFMISWQTKKYMQLMKASERWSDRRWRVGGKLGAEKAVLRLHSGMPPSPKLRQKIHLLNKFSYFFHQ